MRVFFVTSVAATMLATSVSAAAGQATGQRTHWFDLTFGVGRPLNGKYLSATGPAIDANFAFQLGHGLGSSPTMMIAAAAQSGLPVGDKCVPDTTRGCLENLASIWSFGVLLGWQYRDQNISRPLWSISLAAGPGLTSVRGDDYGEFVRALSLHGRIDAALSIRTRGAVVASARTALLPSAPLSIRSTGGVGLGFRIAF
jgi:hypothetical protein